MIDKIKLRITGFTTELDGEIDKDLRTAVLTEVDVYSTEHYDNQNGTYDLIYKAKVNGSTKIKQGGKVARGKSKRRTSQKLRQRIWLDNPDEEYYETIMQSIILNYDEVVEFLQKEGKLKI